MISPPTTLVSLTTTEITALANTETSPILISVRDATGTGVVGAAVTFTVVAGGGSLPAGNTAVSDANGTVTVPMWKLGKSAVQQILRATVGTQSLDINASVQTSYDIIVRFWGPPISDVNKALFTNAATRIMGIVIGDVDDIETTDFDLAFCGVIGEPLLNERIDDVVIYASIQAIDGAGAPNGNILALAYPCVGRQTTAGFQPAIGVIQFDSFDFPSLQGSLQDVVTHEIMHVLGFGLYWDNSVNGRNLLQDVGTGDPRYAGSEGRQGCITVGGATTCAASVPVENAGGQTVVNIHWRESIFGSELMTSLLSSSNPLSAMTIGALADLGLVVNSADFDAYTIPERAVIRGSDVLAAMSGAQWERIIQPTWIIEKDGRAHPLRPK